jgi:hypothetical protein
MKDGLYVDRKTLFRLTLVPELTMVVSYLLSIHMYLVSTYLVVKKCLTYTYIVTTYIHYQLSYDTTHLNGELAR